MSSAPIERNLARLKKPHSLFILLCGVHSMLAQDCGHTETDKIIERYVKDHGIEHYRQPNLTDPKQYLPKSERKWTGYYKIARHYQFALTTVFNHKDNFDSTIIIEDDLEIAPDFFEFFVMGRQVSWSTLCVCDRGCNHTVQWNKVVDR